jgi:hypothetical protein
VDRQARAEASAAAGSVMLVKAIDGGWQEAQMTGL